MESNENALEISVGFKLNVFQVFALIKNKISNIRYETHTLNNFLFINLYGTKPILFNTINKSVKIGSYIIRKHSENYESRLFLEKVDTYMTRANMYDKNKSEYITEVFFSPIKYALSAKGDKEEFERKANTIQENINHIFKSAVDFSKYDSETDKVFIEPVNKIIDELETQFKQ